MERYSGRIIHALSGFYYVETAGAVFACNARGSFRNRNITPLVGDLVEMEANGENGVLCEPAATLYRKLRYESRACCRMNEGKLLICLDVFRECGIFSYEQTGDDLVIRLLNYQGKADINGSSVLKRLMSVLRG